MTFRKRLESEETFQSKLSVLRIPHPNAGALQVGQNGDTSQDPSLNSGMLATDNSVARLQGDRDKTGGRANASHGNDRNGHGIQGVEAAFAALSIVELEGGYRLCYDLGFRISPVAGGLYKKNGSWAMDKTHPSERHDWLRHTW